MNISDRIASIIKSQGLTNAAFADSIGVQRSNISHILSGRSKPGLEFLQKVLQKYPRVNASWLVTGSVRSEHTETTPHESDMKSNKGHSNSEAMEKNVKKNTDKQVDYFLCVYKDGTFEKLLPSV